MTPWLLASLAVADVAFSAFRDAEGRNPRIHKNPYYRRALAGGLAVGLAVAGLCAGLVRAAVASSPEPEALYSDMLAAGQRMVQVYGAYATLVLSALGVWLLGRSELRTLMSVAILGPFTLLRHALIPIGFVWGIHGARDPATVAIAAVGFLLVGSAERVFGWVRRRRGRLWPGEPDDLPAYRP